MTNDLKTVCKVDTYIPARENMAVCQNTVKLAIANGKWQSKTARQIINTYELRPEIKEDFRQMKDFWKSLPIVVKNYKETRPKSVIIYVGQYFGIFPFLEFIQFYVEYSLEVRHFLDPFLDNV